MWVIIFKSTVLGNDLRYFIQRKFLSVVSALQAEINKVRIYSNNWMLRSHWMNHAGRTRPQNSNNIIGRDHIPTAWFIQWLYNIHLNLLTLSWSVWSTETIETFSMFTFICFFNYFKVLHPFTHIIKAQALLELLSPSIKSQSFTHLSPIAKKKKKVSHCKALLILRSLFIHLILSLLFALHSLWPVEMLEWLNDLREQ